MSGAEESSHEHQVGITKSIRHIAEEMNAEAKKKGMHLDRDPWSIPADPNFDIFDRLTPKGHCAPEEV